METLEFVSNYIWRHDKKDASMDNKVEEEREELPPGIIKFLPNLAVSSKE